MKKEQFILSTMGKAMALAIGVAAIALNAMNVISIEVAKPLLSLGLCVISLDALSSK